ncbi:Catalase [Aphelenchoides fujianensis]|nr:Catalase [Aphelenchoides fujianensis]
MSSRPESVHQHMMLWSDRGTPDGYRFMHGFGSHTFKLVNKDNDYVYCKFHAISLQGIKNLSAREAEILAGKDPDYATRDLFNAIEAGEYPQWGFFIQVMTEDQAQKHRWNPFDLTKVWPHADFPLLPVGRITLNKNPTNYFAEVEQVAFCPMHIVPGVDFSPDKMLLGRIFSYRDTAFHRVGTNHMQLPINCPLRSEVNNIQRDGYMCLHSQGDTPAHHPNSFNGPKPAGDPECPFAVNAIVDRYESPDEDNYTQPRLFWEKNLDADHKQRFVENVANGLCMAALPIQERVIQVFSNVHPDIGKGINTQLIKLRGMETQMES